jgi:hypothetical protein
MPNDPYQIGDTDSGITLVLSDRGVSTPSAHGNSTHLTGGSDAIQLATASQVGLMSAAFATKLDGIESGAQLTNSTRIFTALNGVTAATPEGSDSITFLDGTDSALKKVTFTNLFDFLDDTFVRRTGTQSISDTKTFSSVVLTSADINGGTIDGTTINLGANTIVGVLPIANGGTGSSTASGTGIPVLTSGPTITDANLVTPALGTPDSGLLTNCTGLPIANTTGTLSVAKGGTGATSATGTGNVVLANSPTLITPVLGTPAAGSFLTNCTNLPLTTGVTGVLPIVNGGTGFSTNPYGQLGGQETGTPTGTSASYSKLIINTTLGVVSDFDSDGQSNRLRYIGATPRRFLVFASTDITSPTLGDSFAIKLRKNTTLIDETECQARTSGKTSDFIAKLVTTWIIELAQNDYLELFINPLSGDSGTPQRMRLVATPV